MKPEELPSAVLRFIDESIQSVEQLETLLLFVSRPTERWTVESLSRELRSHPRSSKHWLESLSQKGFIEKVSDTDFMATTNIDLLVKLQLVQQTYNQYRVTIIERIFSKPNHRLQTLADAFKFRKDPT